MPTDQNKISYQQIRAKYHTNRSEQNIIPPDPTKISYQQIRAKYHTNRSGQNIIPSDQSKISYHAVPVGAVPIGVDDMTEMLTSVGVWKER